MMMRSALAFVAVMSCTMIGSAVAAPDEATIKVAKSHYEKGNAAYNLGRFDEAITWFTKAYEAWPVPDFLYNIAQSYRLAGNCKQALFVYKRYLSVKEKDKDAPLSKQERAEIERFIRELTDCAAKADASAATPPDALKSTLPASPPRPAVPDSTPATASTMPTPPATAPTAPEASKASPTTTAAAKPTTVAAATAAHQGSNDDPEGDGPEVSATTTLSTRMLSAYATGGIAIFSAGGNLPVPAQPSFAVGAGYPVAAGPLVLDLGARVSFSPIKYDTMDATKQASLVGIRATVGATYRVNDKLGIRGDAGVGVTLLRGLVQGNPFTEMREPGAFVMPSFRVGIAAEYAITPNLVATVAPFSFGISKAPDELFISSLTQIDVLVGLGYRM